VIALPSASFLPVSTTNALPMRREPTTLPSTLTCEPSALLGKATCEMPVMTSG
jgi:hypothetical protein